MINMWPRAAEGYLLNGRVLEIEDDYSAAVENYRKAESFAQDREEIYIFLGMALEKTGDFHQARIVYTKARAVNPKNPGTIRLLKGLEQRRLAAVTASVND